MQITEEKFGLTSSVWDHLRHGRYDQLYKEHILPKRNGGQRIIYAPIPPLARAQRRILTDLLYQMMPSPAAHGFVRRRSIVSAARTHVDACIVIRVDLKDFFPSCTTTLCREALVRWGEQYPDVKEHTDFILTACMREGRLPQGAPTSPALSNLVCRAMDNRMMGVAKKLWARYTRYCDDLVFSARHECQGPIRDGAPAWECDHLMEKLAHPDARGMCQGCTMAGAKLNRHLPWFFSVIESEGFQVNYDKTRIARRKKRQTVNGLVVNHGKDHPRVNKHFRRKTRAMLNRLLVRQQTGHDDGQPYASLAHVTGRIAHIHQADPEAARPLYDQLNQLKQGGAP